MEDVLVLQAARLGDIAQTRRLVASLERGARVHIAVDQALVPLARMLYPGTQVHGLPFHAGAEGRPRAAPFAAIRDIRFAKIYNCNYSPLTAAVCRLFDDDSVVGYRPARHSDGGVYCSPWARLVMRMSRNRRAASLNLVDFWGWLAANPLASQAVNPPAAPGGRGIGVAVAGRAARRSLPPELFCDVVKAFFNASDGAPIRLFGSGAERSAARRLMRGFSAPMLAHTLDLTGKTSWPELLAELSGLDCLLTPDTGLMHLAAHLGVPVMAFFLSSACAHETGPYGQGHKIWQSAPACGPCLENAACARDLACLQPYKSPAFIRCLASLLRDDSAPGLPEMLQLWTTDADNIGQKLTLAAGVDDFVRERAIARALTGSFLKQPGWTEEMSRLPQVKVAAAQAELILPADWMTPPERYW